MAKTDIKTDVLKPVNFLIEDEKVFQAQLTEILKQAIIYRKANKDCYPLYLHLTRTIESVFVRTEKVYPEIFHRPGPDYLDILCELEVVRGQVRDAIAEDDEDLFFQTIS